MVLRVSQDPQIVGSSPALLFFFDNDVILIFILNINIYLLYFPNKDCLAQMVLRVSQDPQIVGSSPAGFFFFLTCPHKDRRG
jgi:hypothetical protein